MDKDTINKVEDILKECFNYEKYIKICELNKLIDSDDKNKIQRINKKIEKYNKKNKHIKECLSVLNEYEIKFIHEKYYKNKNYREFIPLLNKITYNDENINKKINIPFSRLTNNGSIIKRNIILKLLSNNILGVD